MQSVRPMEWDDLDAVVTIENTVYAVPWHRKIFMDCLLADLDCRILKIDESVAGYLVCRHQPSLCHLLNVAVKPQYQHRGHGRYLLISWLKSIQNNFIKTIRLEVRVSNFSAIQLYKQLGFKQTGIESDYYQDKITSEDALIFELDLQRWIL